MAINLSQKYLIGQYLLWGNKNGIKEPNTIWTAREDFKNVRLYLEFNGGDRWVYCKATENGVLLETKKGLSINVDYLNSNLYMIRETVNRFLEHKELFDSIIVLKNGFVFDGEFYENMDLLVEAVHSKINNKGE